jgi:hypothetical protein
VSFLRDSKTPGADPAFDGVLDCARKVRLRLAGLNRLVL